MDDPRPEAGIAAALAARDEQVPSLQQLPYPKLRARLLAQGQVLDLPKRTQADVPKQNVEQAKNRKAAKQTTPKLPNIVVILTDDQGYADIGLNPHHAPEVVTPNVDSLAKQGVFFSQAYTSGHVCSPTRAGLMIGGYSQRVGVYTAGDGGRGFDPKRKIFPAFLPDEYISAAIGKWHKGKEDEWAVRRGDWKLHYRRGKTDLVNLASDPSEENNLADTQPEKIRKLESAYDAWLRPLAEPITGGLKRVDTPQDVSES